MIQFLRQGLLRPLQILRSRLILFPLPFHRATPGSSPTSLSTANHSLCRPTRLVSFLLVAEPSSLSWSNPYSRDHTRAAGIDNSDAGFKETRIKYFDRLTRLQEAASTPQDCPRHLLGVLSRCPFDELIKALLGREACPRVLDAGSFAGPYRATSWRAAGWDVLVDGWAPP